MTGRTLSFSVRHTVALMTVQGCHGEKTQLSMQ